MILFCAVLGIGFALIVSSTVQASTVDGTGKFNFEGLPLGVKIDVDQRLKCVRAPNCPTVSADVAREGKQSMRVFSSFKTSATTAHGGGRRIHVEARIKGSAPRGVHYWYGWSVFLPANWVTTPVKHYEALGQWHTAHNRPIVVYLNGNRWVVVNHIKYKVFTLGALEKGVWTDFVFHIKWSSGADGVLEAWLNEKKVFTYHGPNNDVGDPLDPFFKIGQYRNGPVNIDRIVYYDAIRVAKGSSVTYKDVAPGWAPGMTVKPLFSYGSTSPHETLQ
jgi:hypothetical protein